MKRLKGDIWDISLKYWICIPTNIGWKKDGTNVMGRGLAMQATEKYPELSAIYGKICREQKENTTVCTYSPTDKQKHCLLLVPVKPLNKLQPYMSWRSVADLQLVEESIKALALYTMHVAVPLLGCGNGKLDRDQVLPLLEKYLTTDNFVLVEK